jgi:hypothetical protein
MTAKRITQQTFDEVVQENIEDLEMEIEEAYSDAVQQFESQGVDLSNIWTKPKVEGGEVNPIDLVRKIEEAIPAETDKDVEDPASVVTDIETLTKILEEGGDDKRTLLGCNGAMEALMLGINIHDEEIMPASLRAFKALIKNHVQNRDFVRDSGMASLAFAARSQLLNAELLALCFSTIRAATTKNENNKINFSKCGGNELVFNSMEAYWSHHECLVETCGLLKSITQKDDNRQQFSQAYDCAALFVEKGILERIVIPLKAIGESIGTQAGNGPESIFQACEEKQAVATAAAAAAEDTIEEKAVKLKVAAIVGLCGVIKTLCSKGDSVKVVYDLGGLLPTVQVMVAYLDNAVVVKHTMMVVRAVAAQDDCKEDVSTRIPLILRALELHATSPGVCEQCCATIANLCLKQPDICTTFGEAGAIPLIVQAIRTQLKNKNTEGHGNIAVFMRQAALAIRNMVVRNADLRQPFLDEGVEPLLREGHQYRHCDDECYSALRDLQCEVVSLNRKYTQAAAYKKADNFKDTFDESSNIKAAIDSEAHAPMPNLISSDDLLVGTAAQ